MCICQVQHTLTVVICSYAGKMKANRLEENMHRAHANAEFCFSEDTLIFYTDGEKDVKRYSLKCYF